MRLRKLLFLVLSSVFMLAQSLAAGQDDDPLFTLYSSEPVVSYSQNSSDWDGRYTDPGAVFYHDGQFHMFRNGFQAWPASVQIGYLTSPDGLTWTEVTEDPVLRTDDVSFAEVAALASSALVDENGTWVLFFYTWNEGVPPMGEIGRATAESPTGPWSVDPEPILTLGSEGSWDSSHISTPSVLRTEQGYIMYYAGLGFDGEAIGMATSPDGVVWTKYDDPDTTEAPFAESDPIIVSNREGFGFHQPRVEYTEQGYLMVFRQQPSFSNTAQRGQMGLNIAMSEDGVQWNIITDEPFWGRNSIPGALGFWFTATAYHDETLYLYIEGGLGRNTAIFVATAMTSRFGS
jgi:hypothetical protein